MSHAQQQHRHREPEKTGRNIDVWSIRGTVLVLAILYALVRRALNWDSTPFAAALAVIVPTLVFRDLWNEAKFWITVLLLGAAQVPLVFAVRPLTQQLKFPFLYSFGIVDGALVLLVISRVRSKPGCRGA